MTGRRPAAEPGPGPALVRRPDRALSAACRRPAPTHPARACAGAGNLTAALRAVQEESGSNLPAIGYTVPYAVGNILLTAWGPVIVAMMT